MKRLHGRFSPTSHGPVPSDRQRFLIAQFNSCLELDRLQQQLENVFSLVLQVAMAELDATDPMFLTLPAHLSVFEDDRLYWLACLQGRLFYRSDQYQYDDTQGQAVYCPVHYTRAMIHDRIVYTVQIPDDSRLAASVLLSFRVGQIVGWLSGLAASQKDDAQAGLVLLTTLVSPLLFPNVPARVLSVGKHNCLPAKRKGSRRGRSGVFKCSNCNKTMNGVCVSCGAWYCDDCYNWHCDPELFPPAGSSSDHIINCSTH
jgi:hypothetical protein